MAPTLRLYNTLTRTKADFVPIDPSNVRMYVCGPTVYDYAHIGNARPVIVFDLLFRLLRHLYGAEHVTYVRNVTDVDDKINARAAERGVPIRDITEDERPSSSTPTSRRSACCEPSVEPRATEHIAEMRTLIERLRRARPRLRRRGARAVRRAVDARLRPAVEAPARRDGGRRPRRRRALQALAARLRAVEAVEAGEPSWPSPAGIAAPGRPGWHIECSAMTWKHLGEAFDIHGGGIDLVFPHHENEVAQTRCSFGTPAMANVWMHNGFLQVEGEKMSKSLGNFVTINELLATDVFGGRSWSGEVLRLAMLKTHYRQPIDWTVRALEESRGNMHAWRSALLNSHMSFIEQN